MKMKSLLMAGLAALAYSVASFAAEDNHMPTPANSAPATEAAPAPTDSHAHHQAIREKIDTMSPEQRAAAKAKIEARHAKWKERWEKMTPEEKAKWKERYQKWQTMSPSEQAKMRESHKKMMKHLDHESTSNVAPVTNPAQ